MPENLYAYRNGHSRVPEILYAYRNGHGPQTLYAYRKGRARNMTGYAYHR